jgi:DNA-binding transcriptional ArsR family regulator
MLTAQQHFPPQIEEILSALGDKSRRKIYAALIQKEQTVKELAAPIGITITALGQHIKILEAADLVTSRKVGRDRICSINPVGLTSLEGFIKLQRDLWRSRFDALHKIVEDD